MEKLKIVKIGGNLIDDDQKLKDILQDFSNLNDKKILIHGGGKLASALSTQLGIVPKLHEGRRITDKESLKIVTMVYAGFINKSIVAYLQSFGDNALGLTGADLDMIRSHRRIVTNIDYGFVGDIDEVNGEALLNLMNSNVVPVFCALTHNGKGDLLNTNADTIASALAASLSAHFSVDLIYLFEKGGVLHKPDDDNSVIDNINLSTYEKLKKDGTISSGMIPKLDNAFTALKEGVSSVFVGASGISKERKGTILSLD
ncbi:acetylglutamate kinase [Fulvivirgaceae bacterium BMA10]|uniref:Acetylglutamate kinase n=1 Tax=Splendidivirga corallicola TaxID=3051826 RepID=A0ABT8KMZ1_9BACT|nr:acetylglutamate kinase [Fulvivirgaceae bacterium BMA10]